ncbi:MAG: hypothetical protein JWM44_1782 [Bacilli bacterium]|nr:hypothetical protein [Bacilli bacterium]
MDRDVWEARKLEKGKAVPTMYAQSDLISATWIRAAYAY